MERESRHIGCSLTYLRMKQAVDTTIMKRDQSAMNCVGAKRGEILPEGGRGRERKRETTEFGLALEKKKRRRKAYCIISFSVSNGCT